MVTFHTSPEEGQYIKHAPRLQVLRQPTTKTHLKQISHSHESCKEVSENMAPLATKSWSSMLPLQKPVAAIVCCFIFGPRHKDPFRHKTQLSIALAKAPAPSTCLFSTYSFKKEPRRSTESHQCSMPPKSKRSCPTSAFRRFLWASLSWTSWSKNNHWMMYVFHRFSLLGRASDGRKRVELGTCNVRFCITWMEAWRHPPLSWDIQTTVILVAQRPVQILIFSSNVRQHSHRKI